MDNAALSGVEDDPDTSTAKLGLRYFLHKDIDVLLLARQGLVATTARITMLEATTSGQRVINTLDEWHRWSAKSPKAVMLALKSTETRLDDILSARTSLLIRDPDQ